MTAYLPEYPGVTAARRLVAEVEAYRLVEQRLRTYQVHAVDDMGVTYDLVVAQVVKREEAEAVVDFYLDLDAMIYVRIVETDDLGITDLPDQYRDGWPTSLARDLNGPWQ